MSGMLAKELLYFKSSKRIIIVTIVTAILALAAVVTQINTTQAQSLSFTELSSYIGMVTGLIAATVTFNSVAIDEKAKWDSFSRSLPINVFDIVGAKYLALLIYTASGIAIGILFLLVPAGGCVNGNTLLLLCAISCADPILACCVSLPLFYRFGYQKTNLIVILLICIWPLALSGQKGLTEAQLLFALKLSPVILLAVFVLSFFLSCAVYSRKEF